jgi:hypothetical protein
MFKRPNTTAPAALSFSTTVELYGETKPSRMREATPHGWPFTAKMSLSAIGTPSNGFCAWVIPAAISRSAASACWRASAASKLRNAFTWPSMAWMRSRQACIASRAEHSFPARRDVSSEMVS